MPGAYVSILYVSVITILSVVVLGWLLFFFLFYRGRTESQRDLALLPRCTCAHILVLGKRYTQFLDWKGQYYISFVQINLEYKLHYYINLLIYIIIIYMYSFNNTSLFILIGIRQIDPEVHMESKHWRRCHGGTENGESQEEGEHHWTLTTVKR